MSNNIAPAPAAGNRDARMIWWHGRIRDAGLISLDALKSEFGLQPYRLEQIYRAATKECLDSFGAISVLPANVRERLGGSIRLNSVVPLHEATSHDGQTTKFLFELSGGNEVEAVLMRHRGGRTTACISSQAGCALRCDFCATGQGGFFRNMSSLEIFDQALHVARRARGEKLELTNLVFMGMGEPFLNYDAVMEAVALLNDPHGFGLGARRMTISTAGIVPGIERFTAEHIQVNLAISLHAADDELRTQLMPINKKWPLVKLMRAAYAYVETTHRKIFYEYLMLAGVNDSLDDARRLADLLGGPLHHVNLIPYNATAADYQCTSLAQMRSFQNVLRERGVPSTIRHTMGADIAAACGQLRLETRSKARTASGAVHSPVG